MLHLADCYGQQEGKNILWVTAFKNIDNCLDSLAKNLNAKIYVDDIRMSSTGVDTLESRRLVWINDQIGRGIVIRSKFGNLSEPKTLNWELFIVAWVEDEIKGLKPFFQEYIVQDVPIDTLEARIHDLLGIGILKLNNIKREDLK